MLKTKNNIFENLEAYYKYIVDKFTFIFIWFKIPIKACMAFINKECQLFGILQIFINQPLITKITPV